EDLPRIDIRPLEADEPQVAGRRVKAVVPVAAVGVEGQAAGARLVLQTHRHRDLERNLRHLALAQAQRTASEADAGAVNEDLAVALPPAALEHRLPLLRVERADGDPALDADRVGFL